MELRSNKTIKAYKKYIKDSKEGICFLCNRIDKKINKSFKYWRIIPNHFPYDNIAIKHDMLVVKRHTPSLEKLNSKEFKELIKIKKNIHSKSSYSSILENTYKKQSVKGHYHLHLLEIVD